LDLVGQVLKAIAASQQRPVIDGNGKSPCTTDCSEAVGRGRQSALDCSDREIH
jgi:hypothetical protein